MTKNTNPEDLEAWLSQVTAEEDLQPTHTMSLLSQKIMLRSASRFWSSQNLLLRVLWRSNKQRDPLSRFLPREYIDRARYSLMNSDAWQSYLQNLPLRGHTRCSDQSDFGLFTLVRSEQLSIYHRNENHMTSTLSPTRRVLDRLPASEVEEAVEGYSIRKKRARPPIKYASPSSHTSSEGDDSSFSPGSVDDDDISETELFPADDEQIVNTALILLLNAATLATPDRPLEVTSERKRYRCRGLWTAVTDGYLRRLNHPDGNACALIEVKAVPRDGHRLSIQRQEAGEMVAWMTDNSGNDGEQQIPGEQGYWRLLIAQDRHEMWIVIAEYSDRYKTYLREEKDALEPSADAFMTMTEYGPIVMAKKKHVETFVVFVQAFCLLCGQSPDDGSPSGEGALSATEAMQRLSVEDSPTRGTPSLPSSSGSPQSADDSSPSAQAKDRRDQRQGARR